MKRLYKATVEVEVYFVSESEDHADLQREALEHIEAEVDANSLWLKPGIVKVSKNHEPEKPWRGCLVYGPVPDLAVETAIRRYGR